MKDKHIQKWNVFASVYCVERFQELLDEHYIIAIACLSWPEQHVWRERKKFEIRVRLGELRLAASATAWDELHRTHNLWKKGEKILAMLSADTAIRYLNYALQIAKHGKIVDAVDSCHSSTEISTSKLKDAENNILNNEEVEWGEIDQIFCRGFYTTAVKELKSYIHHEKHKILNSLQQLSPNFGTQLIRKKGVDMSINLSEGVSEVITVVREIGLAELTRIFGITVHTHNNLLLLFLTKHSLFDVQFVHICNGIVFGSERKRREEGGEGERKGKEREEEEETLSPSPFYYLHSLLLLSLPIPKYFPLDSHFAQRIHWPSVKVYKYKKGKTCSLYYHNNQWMLSSNPSKTLQFRGRRESIEHVFWTVWNDLNYLFPSTLFNYSYLFKLYVSKMRKGTKESGREKISLIGVMNNIKMREEDMEQQAKIYSWKSATPLPSKTSTFDYRQCIALAAEFPITTTKGVIVVDEDFHRAKIKSYCYNAFSQLLFLARTHKWKFGRGSEEKGYVLELVRAPKRVNIQQVLLENEELLPIMGLYENMVTDYDNTVARLQLRYSELPLSQEPQAKKQFSILVKKDQADERKIYFAARNWKFKRIDKYFSSISTKEAIDKIHPLLFSERIKL